MKTPRIEPPAHARDPWLAERLEGVTERMFGGSAPRPRGVGVVLAPLDPAPCSRACPVGINVKRYVGLVAEARYAEALEVVRRDNPLAAVCGFLCSRPCELDCARRAKGVVPVRSS